MNKRRLAIIIGIVVVVVVVAVLADAVLANHRPTIVGLEAPEMVVPSGTYQIACIASDRDGDALSYNWSVSGGSISGTGAAVNWTAPVSAGSYNITVAVTDGRGDEVTRRITVQVRHNESPVIDSLVADANWTTPADSIRLTCNASDLDGDVLSYVWTATGGDISGTGPVVNWTAPEEVGSYNITVVVRDGHGGEDIAMLSPSVNLGTPPAIEKLCVTPEGHEYLRDSSTPGCDYDVWKNRNYSIECFASGTGELVYDWSCTTGNITGVGHNITWTAPNKQSTDTVQVKVTVTVTVSYASGNSVSKNIVLHVASCTCGSWGLDLGCK